MRCRWRELLRAGSRLRVQQQVLTDIVFARLIVPRTPAKLLRPKSLTTSYPPRSDSPLVLQQYLGRKVPRLSPKAGASEPMGAPRALRARHTATAHPRSCRSAALLDPGGRSSHGTDWHPALTPISIRRSASRAHRRSAQGALGLRRLACPQTPPR